MIINCENCKIEVEKTQGEINKKLKKGHRIFCSHKCSCELRSKESLETIKCLECEILVTRRKFLNKGNNFCSKSCSNTYSNKKHKGEESRNFINGLSIYRQLALNNYINECKICKFDKLYALQVHHIDEDRDNNKLNNLIILCANCHIGVHKKELIL